MGLDKFDAPFLSASGLASHWLSFYSVGDDNRGFSLNALPVEELEKKGVIRIPLDIKSTESNIYNLTWTLPQRDQFDVKYYIKDNVTGEAIELIEGQNYSFELAPEKISQKEKSSGELPLKNDEAYSIEKGDQPRFDLLIVAEGEIGMESLGIVPDTFTLDQNYPNPFNPTTVISYQLPISSEVRLEVYDMLGRNVATLVNGQVPAGQHTVNFDASNLSSGIYLYRLQAGARVMSRRLTVVK